MVVVGVFVTISLGMLYMSPVMCVYIAGPRAGPIGGAYSP